MRQPRKLFFRFTISRKLFVGFIMVLLILLSTVALGYSQISKVDKEYAAIIKNQAYNLILFQKLNVNVKKEQSSLRGYLLLGDATTLQDFTDAHNDYKALSRDLEKSIKNPKAVALLQEVIKLENQYYHVSNKAIKLVVAGNAKEALAITSTEGQEIVAKFDQKVEELSAYQQTLLDEGNQAVHKEVEIIKLMVLLLGASAVVISLLISWFIGRIISRPIVTLAQTAERIAAGDLTSKKVDVRNNDEVGDLAISFNEMSDHLRQLIQHVGSSAEQVAASSQQLTATSEQASYASSQIAITMQKVAVDANNGFNHLEEASKTIHEMSTGVQHIADRTNIVSRTAIAAFEKASEGDHAIQTVVGQMSSIHHTVEGLSAQINGLGERSAQIGNILNAISDIARQTNILSLNAGIEAARAGEHGRGFLVIASEIRKLAEQSSQSADKIAQLIVAIQVETEHAVQTMGTTSEEVSAGIEAVHSAGAAFTQIKTSVNSVNDEVHEVLSLIQQMAGGAEQIVSAMKAVTVVSESTYSGTREVSAATEEQLASIEEVSASAKGLSNMAEELQTQIDRFKV
ncbi:methyl-accepting chemotaxis protein [Paenibacillus sp. GSMTC-2017]|uniref:methyl-accepting chemotaxis protein n=1 Tax=Paenibacillus sp. GSMTC-2017 TaxID=2794350 RepID=UPI0018D8B999|nr:methyl-accepting chemotaxis protein [Paenibacillus sp. GSMTC-2017]MBH5318786.1 methyl-accepting chemotaxis protein [Paenibacillus sp. GSMTC-2017]